MHIVWKEALLSSALVLAALPTTAQATVVLSVAPPLISTSAWQIDEAALTAMADAAVIASQAPPVAASVSPVPEPPVYIMLLVGVGLLGLSARRRTPPPKFDDE